MDVLHHMKWANHDHPGLNVGDLAERSSEDRLGRVHLDWRPSHQSFSVGEFSPQARLARMTLSHPRFGYTGGLGFQEWPYREMTAALSTPYPTESSYFRPYSGQRTGA